MKHRNQLAKMKIALLAYRRNECETQEDLKDRKKYLCLIKKQSLNAPWQRVSGTGTECGLLRARLNSQASSFSAHKDEVII